MKIGYFITARLKSRRLKQKILLDLNGKTILERVIERCKKVKGIDDVILCTSTHPQDSILFDVAQKTNIKFYKGSEDDVLLRLYDAAISYEIDAFLSITADNPLHSYYFGTVIVESYKKENFDFIFTKGLPIGIAPYFLKTKALEVAIEMKKESDTEIWGPFVNQPDFFNIGNIVINGFGELAKIRLTCDYPEDYELFKEIYSAFPPTAMPTIFDVFDYLKIRPELLKINETIKQREIDPKLLEKIQKDFWNQIKSGRNYAIKNNIKLKPNITTIEINY